MDKSSQGSQSGHGSGQQTNPAQDKDADSGTLLQRCQQDYRANNPKK